MPVQSKVEAQTAPVRENRRFFWVTFLIILVFATWLRFQDLALRPMHNDEGVNFHFVNEINRIGYYPYSHENYHGPSYFYLLKLCTDYFGFSEWAIRFPTALFGVLTIVLLLPLRWMIGGNFVLLSALLIALSASLVFYSRYAIHETIFLFATVWFALAAFLWIESHAAKYIYNALLALALLISTKETWIINVFCVGLGILSLGEWKRHFKALCVQKGHFFYATLLSILCIMALFSAGFTWSDGLREMILAIPQWVKRSDADYGHHKPFSYYGWKVIFPTEIWVVVLLAIGALWGLWRIVRTKAATLFESRNRLPRFLVLWGISSFVVYSYVPYKTPWLVINITLPLILCCAWVLSRIFALQKHGWLSAVFVTAIVCFFAFFQTIYFNFREIYLFGISLPVYEPKPYGEGNPFSYVHTSDGMLELVNEIKEYEKAHGQARILIGVAQYWPLPYYLREEANHVAYLRSDEVRENANRYDIMVVTNTVKWSDPKWRMKYWRLSDVQETNTYFRIKP